MPYELKPQDGESILLDVRFQPSAKSEPFHFAVTNQAVYLPIKKFVVSGDPRCFQRVPNADIRYVSVQKANPYGAWAGAALMVAMGVTLTLSLLSTLGTAALQPRLFGWALALTIGGLLLPWAAKGRQRLVVVMAKGVFRWNPPFVVDKRSKLQVQALLQSILDTCHTSGVPVSQPSPGGG